MVGQGITHKSWQKCMLFSKCSEFEAKKKLYTSTFAIKELKGRTITSNKQNLESKAL